MHAFALKPGIVSQRIVLAKVGLDGHDRGIKVVARGLRDAGFHVIYSGIWQSPDAVAQAVADEGADWLGISLLNGAHLTLVPRVLEQLMARRADVVGVLVGGIIPERDVASLKALGVSACFGPGTPISHIVDYLHSRPRLPITDISAWVERCCQHDRWALSQLLTCLANNNHIEEIQKAVAKIDAAGTSTDKVGANGIRTIAFTGSAGVGKSSLIARLLSELRMADHRVAVLLCDPQSPITGGALLGDRLRMASSQPDEGVFIRSLATPCGLQGIAPHLDLMVQVLRLFGFGVVLIETAGIGQGDVAIRTHAQKVVLLLQPESGDPVQWEKAGVLEIADVIVIHKSDLPGADRMNAELHEHLHLTDKNAVPILQISTARNEGVSQLGELMMTLIE